MSGFQKLHPIKFQLTTLEGPSNRPDSSNDVVPRPPNLLGDQYTLMATSQNPNQLLFGQQIMDLDKILPVIGFGFHEDDSDCRVLRIFFRLDNYLGDLEPRVEVYSSRSDSWRRVSTNFPHLVNHSNRAFVNGSVYWLAANSKEWIVSFDFKNEVFEEFKLPASFRHGVGRRQIVVLMEFKGLVSNLEFEDFGNIGSFTANVLFVESLSLFEDGNAVFKQAGHGFE
ncbi:hypothetical protein LguiB_006379 [Lonicera macranthoides]